MSEEEKRGRKREFPDEAHYKVLRALQRYGRENVATLAKMLQMKRSTVNDRINRLIERGVIRGFSAVVDFEKIELSTTAFVLIEIDRSEGGFEEIELGMVKKYPQRIRELHRVSGEYDIIIKVKEKSLKELGDLLEQIRIDFPVKRTRTLAVFKSTIEEVSHPFDLERIIKSDVLSLRNTKIL